MTNYKQHFLESPRHTGVYIKEFYLAFDFIEQFRVRKFVLFKHKQT